MPILSNLTSVREKTGALAVRLSLQSFNLLFRTDVILINTGLVGFTI